MGPYHVETHDGMKYFLTLVDDCTRWTWIFLLRLKSDVSTVLKNFISMVDNQFGKKIKIFRSDKLVLTYFNNMALFIKVHAPALLNKMV